MKKSLRRKLIMSAIAVGAAAVGTTASTYAWFVTNSTVSSTVSGSVQASGASLFISADGNSFGTKPVVPSADFSNLKMAPLQMKSADKKLYDLNDTEKTANVDYMSFSLYFSVQNLETAANDYKIVLKTTAKDKDSAKSKTHEAQTSINASSPYSAIAQGASLWDNVLKSMNVAISQEYSATKTFGSSATTAYYAVNKSEAIYDGLAYYNKITGNSKAETGTQAVEQTALTTTALETSSNVSQQSVIEAQGNIDVISNVTGNGYYKLDFKIWLDGWDKACFDAIASHEFDLGLTFELASTPKNQA